MLMRCAVIVLCLTGSLALGQDQTPGAALDALVAYQPAPKKTPDEATLKAAAVLSEALKNPAKLDASLKQRIDEMVADRGPGLFPTRARPLTESDPLSRTLAAYVCRRLAALPVQELGPAPAEFPGDVPADALTTHRDFQIDCRVPGRHSLGLYAAPGAHLTVRVESADAGLKVRIGSHSDNIAKRPSWPRMPEVTRVFPLTQEVTLAACAFGGLVYIEVPGSCKVDKTTVSVAGAVVAPLFILGETSTEAWGEARNAPGPWAELGTRKVILTVPSDAIRGLEDPRPVLEFWDRVLDAAADLATIPHDRPRPERYVADAEISAGYMHSGYPIMTHLDAAKSMVNLEAMQKGQWGLFHELGHNHQKKEWTFAGTTEVTCNLFSMYILEEVCGKPAAAGHEAIDKAHEKVAAMMKAGKKPWGFDSSPDDKQTGAGDPFTRLIMYRELVDAFGWAPFKKVFAQYRDLPEAERPKTDEDRRDLWCQMMSAAIGRDLGPFFDAWGVPVSEKVKEKVRALEGWMPERW